MSIVPPPPPVAPPPPPPSPLTGKLAAMRQAIADSLIERDDEADVLVRCLVAHENPLFVGPPGCAKSLMFRNLSKCIVDLDETTYFECLLGKYTEPSELFGPIRVSGLKEDRYVRKVERYMPTAYIAFIDEALDVNTPILTPSGWKTIGELTVGDYVYGSSGLPTRVCGVTEIKHSDECYELTFRDDTVMVADGGHLWTCMNSRDTRGTWYVKTTREMYKQYTERGMKFQLPVHQPIEFPEARLPLDPYVLGIWLGNGNCTCGEIYIRDEWLDSTMAEVHKSMPEAAVGRKTSEHLYAINVGGTHMRSAMKTLDLIDNKHVPNAYLMCSVEQRLRLLQGLVDTDGSINDAGTVVFSNTNESIIKAVVFIVRSLGYQCQACPTADDRVGAKGLHKQCWKVSWRPKPEHNPFLCRGVVISDRTWRMTNLVKDIKPCDGRLVRCIQVEAEDKLFVAGTQMAVTHNCWKASTAILNTLLTILNEHEYDNDGVRMKCPLKVAGAASNEWPSAEELGALFDRFLVRRIVRPVSRANRARLLTAKLPTPTPVITLAELELAHQQAIMLPISDEALACYLEIEEELEKQGIVVGDRRARKAFGLAQAEAFINGATTVQPIHLEPLADVLWVDPVEHPAKTLDIVTRLANPKQSVVNRLLSEIADINMHHAVRDDSTRRAASRKLLEIEETAKAINTPKALRVATQARKNWNEIQLSNLNLSRKAVDLVTGS